MRSRPPEPGLASSEPAPPGPTRSGSRAAVALRVLLTASAAGPAVLAQSVADPAEPPPIDPPPTPVEVLGNDPFPPDNGPLDEGQGRALGMGELERLSDLLRGSAEPSAKTALDARVEPLTFYADSATAAPTAPLEPSFLRLDEWNLGFHVGGEQASRTGISDNPGSIETRRILLGAGFRRPGSDGSLMLAEWNLESTHYRFDGAVDVITNSQRPIEDMVENRFGLHYQASPDRRLSLAASLEVASGMEPSADFIEGVTGSGALALSWRPDPAIPCAVTLGAWATSELAGDVNILPIAGLEWEIDDRTRLHTTLRASRVARPGLNQSAPGLVLERDVSPAATVWLRGRYRERHSRLDDEGPLSEGAIRDREVQAALGIDWSPGLTFGTFEGFWASFWIGSNVDRELTFYEGDDDEFESRSMDGGVVFGLNLRFAF